MNSKRFSSLLLFSAIFLLNGIVSTVHGQADNVWTHIDGFALLPQQSTDVTVLPDRYEAFRLNKASLETLLKQAPEEFTSGEAVILTLPMPDGTLGRFEIEHSLVVEPGLLKKYPELGATYRGHGINDPTATVRFDFLPSGFHAMVLSAGGTVMIDPFSKGDTATYAAYFKRELPETEKFKCEVGEPSFNSLLNENIVDHESVLTDLAPDVVSGTQLRTYRLALAADNEYAAAVGGNTIAGTLAAEVLIMNRVNGIYERDLAIHMNIVANNDLIAFAGDNMSCGGACTSANDPYTNNSGSTMLSENQTKIDAAIGMANYDIGHVFSTGGGGVAFLSVPCGGSKAGGVTGLTNPVGDAFAIDYVAHEMGHQWGANHTFNGAVSNCAGGNRSGASAYETGSGITIMAYAGICGNQDLDRHSIDTFHVKSLEAIIAYSQTGNGNTCAVTTSSDNTAPTVSVVGGPFNIPKQTPFALTATGSDINGDTLTYDWQEYDLGSLTTAVPNSDSAGSRPVLRPYLQTLSPVRIFPSLTYILGNANVPPATYDCGRATPCLVGEMLPQIGRTMSFQVIARDNHNAAGGINTATASVIVDGSSGPFAVTSPNTGVSYNGGSAQTVTWNVASTTNAPVNAANVKISFSSDGGHTFPMTLLANTPNDGSETITIPNISTASARIKIEAAGNIFFDISDANFTVTAVSMPVLVSGRVFTSVGLPLKNAAVSMMDSNNVRRTVLTNSFGSYSFDNVLSGDTYIFSVSSKRFRFSSQTIQISDNFSNLDFTGLE